MAFDAFIKIDGIPGECQDSKHQNWIEVLSYHHGLVQPVSSTASSSGGATAERVDFGDFSFLKLVDLATPKLVDAGCTGKHIKEVTLEVCRAGGDKEKYLVIKMTDVLISSYVHSGNGDFPTESVSLNPGKFSIAYTQQKHADGTPGGNLAAGWDLTENKIYVA